jgi:arylsulfatase A-like enzyme
VLASKAFGFLDEALVSYRTEGKPFFMTIAPTAPHSNVHMNTFIDGNFNEGSNTQSPPVPAPRHAHLFSEIKVPRTPNFNPSNPHGVSWISQLPQQNQTNLDFNDHFYRSRLRALQAVDEMIDDLFAHLTPEVLQNTYIFFSTDNGYHIGQHRLQPGKQCAFEEDVNIPFIVRGPGIPQNHSTDIVTTHTDLAPTFLALAGATLRADFDGQVIPLHGLTTTPQHDRSPSSSFRSSPIGHSLSAPSSHWSPEHINIEQWGVIMSEGNHGSILYPNHTYKALRLISPTNGYNLLYTVWCSGEHELYNLLADPYETENLYPRTNHTGATISLHPPPARHDPYRSDTLPPAHDLAHHDAVLSSVSLDRLLPRLDALLMVLKTCKARQCTHPWEVLHPHDTVRDLEQAMDARYDEFYAAQAKVAFDRCEKAYIPESEGAMWVGFDNAT